MKYIGVLAFFLILVSCTSKQQKTDESTEMDTSSQVVAPPDGTLTMPDTAETIASPAPESFKRSTNQLENFRTITHFQPGRPTADMSIRDFTRVLGASSEVVKDSDSSCPVGQLHFWNVSEQNYRIFALGDAYSPRINTQASCRLYGIQLLSEKESAGSAYEGFLGITLGETSEVVEQKLKIFVDKNPSYQYEKLKDPSMVEHFLTERQKWVFVLTDGKRYYHFAIGKKQKLNYILLASFNPKAAC